MAIHLTKLLPLARLNTSKYPRHLASCIISKRYVQEFPDLKLDNRIPKDYLIILPESLSNEPQTNELLRIPKIGERETDFTKITVESLYKGLSHTLNSFENYVSDVNNEIIPLTEKSSLEEIFKEIEKHLLPMDTAHNILSFLISIETDKHRFRQLYDLITRYYKVRELRFISTFTEHMNKYNSGADAKSLSDVDKSLLRIYYPRSSKFARKERIDEATFREFKKHLQNEINRFKSNLNEANRLFSHTVDDPDILSRVSSDFYQTQELRHKERTPLKVNINTYQKFMQVCPDRFIRQNLWQVKNKRCSPKAHPKYNNISIINSIRVYRRKIADLSGYRSHIEFKLQGAMAKSKQEILDNLAALNNNNQMVLGERLQELNDYAFDNNFDGSSHVGLQEFDIDFWSHKYKHEILIGKSETELKNFFPLKKVMSGIQSFFNKYFGIELRERQDLRKQLWNNQVNAYEIIRKGQPVGTLIHDPYSRDSKSLVGPHIARLRGKSIEYGNLPMRILSTSYIRNGSQEQAQLSFNDIVDLFYSYGSVIQRLLYNYKYYELNTYGAFEVDAENLFPYFCVAHLLSDYRVLQACSDRDGSKPIDAETAQRIQKAATYFKSFRRWHDLYKAHLDCEAHSTQTDIKALNKELSEKYSPFGLDLDNFEYCTMVDIFAGSNDGVQYKELWSKQLANYCLQGITGQADDQKDLASIDIDSIKKFNIELVDQLFHPENLNTREKLASLIGTSFEPPKTDLGVL